MSATPPSSSSASDGGPAFQEALWFGPVGWFGVAGLSLTAWVALLPVDATLASVVALVVAAVLVVLAVRATPRVRVARGELTAGRAHIPLELLRDPVALEGDALREALGPGLDARAHVCLRGWLPAAVRVDVVDPQDPTPYWIISTRRPARLVAALGAAGHS